MKEITLAEMLKKCLGEDDPDELEFFHPQDPAWRLCPTLGLKGRYRLRAPKPKRTLLLEAALLRKTRNYFAGQALAGLLVRKPEDGWEEIVAASFELADEMIEEARKTYD